MADALKFWLAKEIVGLGLFLGVLLIFAIGLGIYFLYLVACDKIEARKRVQKRNG